MVHAIVNPHATDPDNAMTFRTVLSPAEAGRMEKGGASYGNTDLPNLRSAAVAEILTALIDGCQQMGGTGVDARSSPTQVEILDGQVYPQHSVPDRKARVHVVAYLSLPQRRLTPCNRLRREGRSCAHIRGVPAPESMLNMLRQEHAFKLSHFEPAMGQSAGVARLDRLRR